MLNDIAPSMTGSVLTEAVTSPSAFSMDYYRQKVVEFQRVLDALDEAERVIIDTLPTASAMEDSLYDDLMSFYDDLQGKKTEFRLASEAINAASAGFNAVGVNFPRVNLPQSLGALPFVALAAAIVAVTGLIVWGLKKLDEVHARLTIAGMLTGAMPEERIKILDAAARLEAAKNSAQSPFASIAKTVQWIAIGALVWFGYQAWRNK